MELRSKEGFFDRTETIGIGDVKVQYRRVLPYKAKTWMAIDLVEKTVVFDEERGVAFEGYTWEPVYVYLMMQYYTDMDLSPYEGEDGAYTLYDILVSHGVLDLLSDALMDDLIQVRRVYELVKDAAIWAFERGESLDHLIRKSFGFLFSGEDLTETVSKAETVNNTMVDMLGAFMKEQSPAVSAGGKLLRFGKKEPRKQ